MIRILSKKAFRFSNPEIRILGFDNDTGAVRKQPDFKDAYFETTPNEIQDAPDWIKLNPMWKWATADGDLLEITVQPTGGPSEKDRAVAQAAEAAQRSKNQLEEAEVETKLAPKGKK